MALNRIEASLAGVEGDGFKVEHQRLVVRGLATLRLDGSRERHEAPPARRAWRAAPHVVDSVLRPLRVAGMRRPRRRSPLRSVLLLQNGVGIDEAAGAYLAQARLLRLRGGPTARLVKYNRRR